jgi:hypothetical protein
LLNLRHLLVHSIELLGFALSRGRTKADLVENGEDAASRGVPGGGEDETSPETRTARLAVTSPAEVRSKNLWWRYEILGSRVRWSPKLGKMGGIRERPGMTANRWWVRLDKGGAARRRRSSVDRKGSGMVGGIGGEGRGD